MSHPFSVMTFNIRTSLANDGRHDWTHRRDLVARTILDRRPDLIGIQEPTVLQWGHVAEALEPGWVGIPHSRQDEYGSEPHLQGGFVRRQRFDRIADGCFWLSDTPAVPGSKSFPLDWGARTVGWMRLKDRAAGREIVFAVTHFDTNEASWLPSAEVMGRELVRAAAGAPIVVVGDFNCAAGSPAWKHLTGEAGFRDAWTEAGLADAGVLTYNAFQPDRRIPLDDPGATRRWLDAMHGSIPQFAHYTGHILAHGNYRIDWIMIRESLKSTGCEVDYRTEDGLLPSDHYPVIATLEWV
jgi:endonuclease/exonuclease/phosphatase family metal-dependent hydrolase